MNVRDDVLRKETGDRPLVHLTGRKKERKRAGEKGRERY